MSGRVYFFLSLLFTCTACSSASFDVSGDHLALADRHDFDEEGNAFLRFEEDRAASFLLSAAQFSDEDWLGLSVRKQRDIEENIKRTDAFLVQNIALSQLNEGASLSLSSDQHIVSFSEPGRFLDEGKEVTFAIDDVEIESTSGKLRGTLTFSSFVYEESVLSAPASEEHVIDLNLSFGRERVVKRNLIRARNFLICATSGDNCF